MRGNSGFSVAQGKALAIQVLAAVVIECCPFELVVFLVYGV
jgi:hypothetical protein